MGGGDKLGATVSAHQWGLGDVTAELAVDGRVDVAAEDVVSLDINVHARKSLGDSEGSLLGGQVVVGVDFDAVCANDGDVNRDRHGC